MNGTFLPETETTEFENRVYVNPETSLNEQNSFIDNYRDTVKQNTNQITTQTRNLGTDVSSNLGGLTGGTGYWTSRYQTPQTNTAIADLRATAQAQALNTVLSNEKAKWQKRYDDAYKAYQKRQNDKTNTSTDAVKGDSGFESTTTQTYEGDLPGATGGYTTARIDTETGKVTGYDYVPYGEDGKTQYTASLNDYSNVGSASVVGRTRREGDMTKAGANSRNGIIRVWRLPNGTVTNVDSVYYTIVQDAAGNYYAKDRSNGNLIYIGS